MHKPFYFMKHVKRITHPLLLFGLSMMLSLSVLAQDPVWSEEFDGSTIDRSVWLHETGGNGSGNGELQYYTASSDNAYIEDGNLVLEARQESYEGKEFTSARLRTLGRFAFKYGTLEARIKLPDVANGLWPAFWLMGNNYGQAGWPQCGETDIMEVGKRSAIDDGTVNSTVSAAAHWWHESGDWGDWLQADYSESVTLDEAFYEDYHSFSLDWTPESLSISVDDSTYFVMDITDENLSEFVDNPAFILLNLAVGGYNFVEISDPADITAPFPAKMYVDYVRLYENEYTELYIGAELAHRGNFGIYTETTDVEGNLNFGAATTNLYIWNNMTATTSDPAEGNSDLSYTVAAGDWWGMGIHCADQNMSYYKNGYLHFRCKTTFTGNINISISSSAEDGSGIDLVSGGEEYGMARDGDWHEVAIPLYEFSNVDFNTVNMMFAASGADPGADIDIAFDDIYWSESIELPTPEYGSFGVYTETPDNMTAGTFGFGVTGDLFIWENTLESTTTTPAEGNSALSFASTGAGWYGLGLTARIPFNLSAFDNENGAFHFSMKTTSTEDFRIVMKSGNTDDLGQKWIWFNNGDDPYDFVRDGEWHDITIPIADLASDVDLMNVTQLFQVLGTTEISDIAFDNIYFSGGEAATDPGTDGEIVNRAPVAAITASATGGPAPLTVVFDASQSTDVNADTLTYSWDFGEGSVASGVSVSHTFTDNGSYTVSLVVSDNALNDTTTYAIFVNDNYGTSKSAKRGVGYGYFSEADMAALSPGISWWYNWGTLPESGVADVHLDYGVEYVPMAWNGGFNESQIVEWLADHPEAKYNLGWNEPNFLEQANMTPSEAAAEWPRLEEIAAQYDLKIVSPAMNYCGECVTENGTTYYDPIEYLDDFFTECSDCQVDAIAIHSYMGTVGAFEWYVDLFKKYDLPIWVTEFCNWENDPTLEDQKKYMIHAVDYLENDPDVERYAWFIARHQGAPYMSLLEQQSGVLTELGQIYINMPVHDSTEYYEIPGLIEAEDYTSMSGVRPEITEDQTGFLNLSEIEAEDWMAYQVDATIAGTFDMLLRVASDEGAEIQVLVDDVLQQTITVAATGGTQQWTDVSTSLSISSGAHTITLVNASGTFNLNYFSIDIEGDVNHAPEAVATADVYSGTAPLTVNFDASASSDEDGDELSYEWAFGGVNEEGVTTTYVFSNEGTYYVALIVSDGALEDMDTTVITVNVETTACGTENLALNKSVTASSEEGVFVAESAVDGDSGTRWGSDFVDDEWIMVDLGASYTICEVDLNWEDAYGSDYEILLGTTTDMESATVIATITGEDGGTDVISTDNTVAGQYLWMKGISRGTGYGYSLWELEVYGALVSQTASRQGKTNVLVERNEVRLYPNPVEDELNVTVTLFGDNDMVTITNVTGTKVLEQRLNGQQATLDVSSLNPGVYLLQIVSDQPQTIRFIKK